MICYVFQGIFVDSLTYHFNLLMVRSNSNKGNSGVHPCFYFLMFSNVGNLGIFVVYFDTKLKKVINAKYLAQIRYKFVVMLNESLFFQLHLSDENYFPFLNTFLFPGSGS